MGDLPLRTPTHRRLGGPLHPQLPNAPHAHPRPESLPFLLRGCPQSIYAVLDGVSTAYPPARGRLHTCYSPVRRSPASETEVSDPLPLDLHVLSLSLAFILSQDQTLRCIFYLFRFSFFFVCLSRGLPVLFSWSVLLLERRDFIVPVLSNITKQILYAACLNGNLVNVLFCFPHTKPLSTCAELRMQS